MKTITKGKTPFLAIPVPKEAFYFDWKWSAREEHIIIYWETEDGWVQGIKTDFKSEFHFEILNKFSELREEECEEFVQRCGLSKGEVIDDGTVLEDDILFGWKNYTPMNFKTVRPNEFSTAKESLQSLLNFEGFDNNTLIVKIL